MLCDLRLGKPIRKNVKVPIEKIVRKACSCYALATRYLVIDSYKKKEKIGYDIYIKVMSLDSDEETSKKRLEQFIRLIGSQGQTSKGKPSESDNRWYQLYETMLI